MNNKLTILLVVILVVGAGVFLIKSNTISGSVIMENGNKNNIQEVKIGFKNYNYYPQEVELNVNQPVRIYLDDNVYGCYRAFTIRSLGISEFLETSNDYVEFTPTKTGNYPFSCSMGMGTGMLVVK